MTIKLILSTKAKELQERLDVSFTPTKATERSAGYDVRACIEEPITIHAGQSELIPLGFRAWIGSDEDVADLAEDTTSIGAFILPRSGLGSNKGIVLGNLVGLVDEDYQNEWMCSVWNRNTTGAITIEPVMKLAQIVFLPFWLPAFESINDFSRETGRKGGFGHTGDK